MIYKGLKEIIGIYRNNKNIIIVYKGIKFIWSSVRACFTSVWNNDKKWSNIDPWKNSI